MNQVVRLVPAKAARPRKPTLRAADRLSLARIADALVTAGRADLAAHMIEALYYMHSERPEEGNVLDFRPVQNKVEPDHDAG